MLNRGIPQLSEQFRASTKWPRRRGRSCPFDVEEPRSAPRAATPPTWVLSPCDFVLHQYSIYLKQCSVVGRSRLRSFRVPSFGARSLYGENAMLKWRIPSWAL